MGLTQEDIVTKMLSDSEIIKVDHMEDDLQGSMYSTNPLYDLNCFLKNVQNEPSRWGEKYMFVK